MKVEDLNCNAVGDLGTRDIAFEESKKRLDREAMMSYLPLALSVLWIFIGTVFYAVHDELGWAKGLFESVNVGWSVGWSMDGLTEYDSIASKIFTIYHTSIGVLFAGVTVLYIAQEVGKNKDNWIMQVIKMKELDEATETKGCWISFVSFLKVHLPTLRIAVIFLMWFIFGLVWYPLTNPEFGVGKNVDSLLSTLTAGGYLTLPSTVGDCQLIVTAIYSNIGIPLLNIALGVLISLMLEAPEDNLIFHQIIAPISPEEIKFMKEIKINNGDGIVDSKEFIILAAVRTGGATPDLIGRINLRFMQLDYERVGRIRYDDIIKSTSRTDDTASQSPVKLLQRKQSSSDSVDSSTRFSDSVDSPDNSVRIFGTALSSFARSRANSSIFVGRAMIAHDGGTMTEAASLEIAANIAKIERLMKMDRINTSSPCSSRRIVMMHSVRSAMSHDDEDSIHETVPKVSTPMRPLVNNRTALLRREGSNGREVNSEVMSDGRQSPVGFKKNGDEDLDGTQSDAGGEIETCFMNSTSNSANPSPTHHFTHGQTYDSNGRKKSVIARGQWLSSPYSSPRSSMKVHCLDEDDVEAQTQVSSMTSTASPNACGVMVSSKIPVEKLAICNFESNEDGEDEDESLNLEGNIGTEGAFDDDDDNDNDNNADDDDLRANEERKRATKEILVSQFQKVTANSYSLHGSKYFEKLQHARKKQQQQKREALKRRTLRRWDLGVKDVKRMASSPGAFAFYLWCLWLAGGTVYYIFEENITVSEAFFISTSIGYGIFWHELTSKTLHAKVFMSYHYFTGVLGVSFAMAVFATRLNTRQKKWYEESRQLTLTTTKSLSPAAKIASYFDYYWPKVRFHMCFFVWMVIGIVWGVFSVQWSVLDSWLFAMTAMAKGGLVSLPLSRVHSWDYVFYSFFIIVGAPLMAISCSKIANTIANHGRIRQQAMKLNAVMTEDELLMLKLLGVENDDGFIDNAEFTILLLARIGALNPELIAVLLERFYAMDDGSGVVTYESLQNRKSVMGSAILRPFYYEGSSLGSMQAGALIKKLRMDSIGG